MNEDNKPKEESRIILPELNPNAQAPGKLGKLTIVFDMDAQSLNYTWEHPLLMERLIPEHEKLNIIHPFAFMCLAAVAKDRYQKLDEVIPSNSKTRRQ